MIRLAVLASLAFALPSLAAEPEIHLTPGPKATPELFAALLEQDRVLFDAAFNRCEPESLPALIHADFEFLHDKSGRIAGSREEFLASAREMCAKRNTGENFTARRELILDSMTVHPLVGYGAMQMGTHRFYAVQAGRPDRLTEVAKFIHVWREVDGEWQLARAISYDHQLAEPPAGTP
jgi:hypothetical protein